MKRVGLVGGLIVGLLLGGCSGGQGVGVQESSSVPTEAYEYQMREVMVGEAKLEVQLAISSAEITKGLGYRDELGVDGMMFVLPQKNVPSFWMKGMRFGLDLVWIECEEVGLEEVGSCEVVDISKNVPAEADPENPERIYQPRDGVQVSHVLEINEGMAEEMGIEIRDMVEW